MKSILVTGATGFIGSALCKELVKRNVPIIKIKISDSTNDSTLVSLKKCEVVVHLAARVHVMKDNVNDPLSEYRKINVDLTLNLAWQAATNGVKRFIYLSSIKVNGESTLTGTPFQHDDLPAPKDAYGVSKLEAELGLWKIAVKTNMEIVIIRPCLVYGHGVKANFRSLVQAVKKGLPLPLGNIKNKRSLIYIGNLVDFIIICTSHPDAAKKTFIVSDGQDLSTSELIIKIAQASSVPCRLFPVPFFILRIIGLISGKSNLINRLCENLQVDTKNAQQILGWVPPFTVEEGLRYTALGVE